MKILDRYTDQLIERSTPEAPVRSIKRIREGLKSTWNYIDGCMIKAIIGLYLITRNCRYLNLADAFTGRSVREDSSIESHDPKGYNLDNVDAGKTLFDLYKLTGKEKYRRTMDTVYSQLEEQFRTSIGSFQHKKIYPNQIWLNGLYMAQPFYTQYEAGYSGCKNCEDSYQQFFQVYDRMGDPLNELYHHAYGDSRQTLWCDRATGLSESLQLRAIGWYATTLIDTVEVMSESMTCQEARLDAIYKELIDAMLPYRDQATGTWYRAVNWGRIAPNYLKEPGSTIFAYAIMKSVHLHYLPDDYFKHGQKTFEEICSTYFSEKDGSLQLGGICLVAGLGNTDMREGAFEYYMRKPVVENEAKGIAPLTLAYIETMSRRQPQDSDVDSGINSGIKQATKVIEPISCFQHNDTRNSSFVYSSPSVSGKART